MDRPASRLPSEDKFAALWQAAFETYHDCFYNEVVADRLLTRWQWVDEVTKVLVAVTASGSALSGWTLWNQPGYKAVWLAFAGIAAILAVVHMTLTVSHRIRYWGEIKRAFSSLRIELETFRYRMRFNGDSGDGDSWRSSNRCGTTRC